MIWKIYIFRRNKWAWSWMPHTCWGSWEILRDGPTHCWFGYFHDKIKKKYNIANIIHFCLIAGYYLPTFTSWKSDNQKCTFWKKKTIVIKVNGFENRFYLWLNPYSNSTFVRRYCNRERASAIYYLKDCTSPKQFFCILQIHNQNVMIIVFFAVQSENLHFICIFLFVLLSRLI